MGTRKPPKTVVHQPPPHVPGSDSGGSSPGDSGSGSVRLSKVNPSHFTTYTIFKRHPQQHIYMPCGYRATVHVNPFDFDIVEILCRGVCLTKTPSMRSP